MLKLLKKFFKKKPISLENYLLYPEGNRYYRETHIVRKGLIDEDALKTIHRLNKFGYKAYIVGGGVRDLLLERRPKDFDVVTNATPNQVRNIFNNCRIIGRRFKLVHVIFKGKVIEVSTFRSLPDHRFSSNTDNETDYLLKRDNNYGTAKEDAARRDFTINALYYDPRNESIIDYVGGFEDIKNKVLRVIGDPDISFKEDPVRMLRAVKFSIIHGLSIEKKTRTSIKKNRFELDKASSSRMLEEYNKIFRTWKSSLIFHGLAENYLFEVLFREVAESLKKQSNRWQEDFSSTLVYKRLQVADRMLSEREELTPLIFYALIFSDLVDEALKSEANPSIYTIRESLESITNRIGISKRDKDRLIKIFASQARFKEAEEKSKNQNDLFKKKDYFYESFMFFKIKALTENNEESIQSAFFWEISSRIRPRYSNRFKKDSDLIEKNISQNNKKGRKNKFSKESKFDGRDKNKKNYPSNKGNETKKPKESESNFLIYDVTKDSLVKFSGDFANIRHKILKLEGDPEIIIKNEPLNILKVVRFVTIHSLRIDSNLRTAIQNNVKEIGKLPFSTLLSEFQTIFKTCRSTLIFQTLVRYNVFEICFPEIVAEIEKNNKNWKDNFLKIEIGKKLAIADVIQSESNNISPIVFYAILYENSVSNIQNNNSKITIKDLRERLEPICKKLEMIKKDRDKLIKVFASQTKFEKFNENRNNKNNQLILKNKDYFESFIFFKISALANNNQNQIELAFSIESKLDYKSTKKNVSKKGTSSSKKNTTSKKRTKNTESSSMENEN